METILLNAVLIAVAAVPLVVLFVVRKNTVVVSIVAMIELVLGIALQVRGSGGTFTSICDAFSFAGILMFAFPLLFLSGRADDFLLALKVAFLKQETDAKDLKKARIAVCLMERLVVFGAIVTSMVGLLSILNYLEDLTAIRPNLAIALLPVLYAAILSALLKSLSAIVEAKIAERE